MIFIERLLRRVCWRIAGSCQLPTIFKLKSDCVQTVNYFDQWFSGECQSWHHIHRLIVYSLVFPCDFFVSIRTVPICLAELDLDLIEIIDPELINLSRLCCSRHFPHLLSNYRGVSMYRHRVEMSC